MHIDHHLYPVAQKLAVQRLIPMANPLSSTSLVFGGRSRATVALQKTIVYTRIVTPGYWLMHLAKSHQEVSKFLTLSTPILNDRSRSLEPAKAGRHLEKALENLRSKRNQSSSSLNTSMVANPSTPESQGTSSASTTPIDIETFQDRIASLQSDNYFLRGLVEQSSKEKCILMTTIEGMQKENTSAFLHSFAFPIPSQTP
jgi:hypothetical protein